LTAESYCGVNIDLVASKHDILDHTYCIYYSLVLRLYSISDLPASKRHLKNTFCVVGHFTCESYRSWPRINMQDLLHPTKKQQEKGALSN